MQTGFLFVFATREPCIFSQVFISGGSAQFLLFGHQEVLVVGENAANCFYYHHDHMITKKHALMSAKYGATLQSFQLLFLRLVYIESLNTSFFPNRILLIFKHCLVMLQIKLNFYYKSKPDTPFQFKPSKQRPVYCTSLPLGTVIELKLQECLTRLVCFSLFSKLVKC